MKAESFKAIMDKLRAACAKEPTEAQYDVLVESITDNRLTDAEIMEGYRKSRDAKDPWWPKPGEFLERARPLGPSTIASEAETIFQNLIDHPTKYGKYNPNAGVILDRKLIEKHHGHAAGVAFASVASRFRGLLEESVPFVRKDFQTAYDDARRAYGAPPTLALPGSFKSLPAPISEVTEPF